MNPDVFGKPIRQRTFIAVSREKVFDTITSAEGWNAFFTTGLEIEARPGGKMIWRWKDWGPDFYTTEVQGEVVKVERPGLFVFQWGSERRTTITFKLIEQFGGTVVDLTEEGYLDTPDDRAMILECAAGWGEALTLLKFYIEKQLVYTPPDKSAGAS